MGFYDAFKDVINIAQKADNIELYKRLLDLSAQALDLQDENLRLKEENKELKKKKDLESLIIRHRDSYITLKDDATELLYCSHCYDSDQKLIQLQCDYEGGSYICPHCKTGGFIAINGKRPAIKTFDDGIASYLSFDPYNR